MPWWAWALIIWCVISVISAPPIGKVLKNRVDKNE